jgi:hypothetical protein
MMKKKKKVKTQVIKVIVKIIMIEREIKAAKIQVIELLILIV